MRPIPANVIAHGLDACDVERIAAMLDRHGARFLERCFTPAERGYAESGRNTHERLAARFAAKEAVFKALGTGWARGIGWTDAEVTRAPAGGPGLRLTGRAAEIAAERGIASWSLSLTHTRGLAIASALALAPPDPARYSPCRPDTLTP